MWDWIIAVPLFALTLWGCNREAKRWEAEDKARDRALMRRAVGRYQERTPS